MTEDSSIRSLKGIGAKTEELFAKLNIFTLEDLLRYYPKGYDIYEPVSNIKDVTEGEVVSLIGDIASPVTVSGSPRMPLTSLNLRDATGSIRVVWFRMPFLSHTLKNGKLLVRGRICSYKGRLMVEHPEIFYPPEKYEQKLHTLQPIYPLRNGITNLTICKAVRQTLDHLDLLADTLPGGVRLKYSLAEYNFALHEIHFPKDKEAFYFARKRLVFQEFLDFLISMRSLKEGAHKEVNHFPVQINEKIQSFIESLPFTLTEAQQAVWNEIQGDMQSSITMSRLIQGDVGSGKTILAILALLLVAFADYQGALMAPTEVLAKQHYLSLKELFEEAGFAFKIVYLVGSMTAKEKKEAYEKITSGEAKIIIGTHALIQDKAIYKNLALVVTDEQHRFGVKQREAIINKGDTPHVLVMSATPIPRTLAMILFGDLDQSILMEKPKNRLPIKNCVVGTSYRQKAYAFMKSQVDDGHQCYVICPMVEENEVSELANVNDYAKELENIFGDSIRIGLLHGRMKGKEKDVIMEEFVANRIQILVSTTVIEVGVNVPNATVMMVENAEQFGLSQLHQLRGRVGRGKDQAYCIFMCGKGDPKNNERLNVLNKSNDGFYIASEDLKLRGPGDVFGIRQSGLLNFRLGDIFQDAKLLKDASEAVNLPEMKEYCDSYLSTNEITPIL